MDEERVKKLVRELIIEVGEDPTREGLKETPKRIASMYKEIFGGYDSDSELSVQFSEDSETVVAKNIQFYSMCEHHMLPFHGLVNIAVFPKKNILGISKFSDLVSHLSNNLTLQEKLTEKIATFIYEILDADGVFVKMSGKHLCSDLLNSKNL